LARITGVDLPREKRIEIALTYIFGIGRHTASTIVEAAKIDKNKRVKELTGEDIANLRATIAEYKVEGSLRTEIQMNIKRLMDIGCYRGLRHRRGLPVRGQRTHTNARTRKGRKRSVGGKNR